MLIMPLGIEGAYEITPQQHLDSRGIFMELYRRDYLQAAGIEPLPLAQANLSISDRGTVRGVHFTANQPGLAKYVTCVQGAAWDFIVDLRVGSRTFGQHRMVSLDTVNRRSVYISPGLGHAICSLEHGTTLVYLCSQSYDPAVEREVWPLDPELRLDFPFSAGTLLLSSKDSRALTLSVAKARGILPTYEL